MDKECPVKIDYIRIEKKGGADETKQYYYQNCCEGACSCWVEESKKAVHDIPQAKSIVITVPAHCGLIKESQ